MHVLDLEFVYCRAEMDRASVTRACASRGGIEGGGFNPASAERTCAAVSPRITPMISTRVSEKCGRGRGDGPESGGITTRWARESLSHGVGAGWEQGGEGVVRNERNDDNRGQGEHKAFGSRRCD